MKRFLLLLLGVFLFVVIGTALIYYAAGYRIDVILVYPITPSDLTPKTETIG